MIHNLFIFNLIISPLDIFLMTVFVLKDINLCESLRIRTVNCCHNEHVLDWEEKGVT